MNFLQKIFTRGKITIDEGNLPLPGIQSAKDLKGKTVFVRVSLDLPLEEDGTVSDSAGHRVKAFIPTVRYLQSAGARVVLAGHIGRDPGNSLKKVFEYLNSEFDLGCFFISDIVSDNACQKITKMEDGEIILLENLRQDEREKQNDIVFARELALLADIYVNEDFSTSHRQHASVSALSKLLPAYLGLHFQKELAFLDKVLQPKKPFVVIMGGLKFKTKLEMIKKYLMKADSVFVVGALANAFYLAKGLEIGQSVVDDTVDLSSFVNSEKIILPKFVVVENGAEVLQKAVYEVKPEEKIIDIAPKSVFDWRENILKAKTVLWNGPFGYFEAGYTAGSTEFLNILEKSSALKIAGGGDSRALLSLLGKEEVFDFVSIGGGAMLAYLNSGKLKCFEQYHGKL